MWFSLLVNLQTETVSERHARGRPIGKPCPYQAMGGLTGFSSLAAGVIRMDVTGAGGQLTEEELNAPITSNDHPFLRSQAQAVYAYKLAQNDTEGKLICETTSTVFASHILIFSKVTSSHRRCYCFTQLST